MSTANFVLTLSCADRPGIVAAVTTELAGPQRQYRRIQPVLGSRNRPLLHAPGLRRARRGSAATPSSATLKSPVERFSMKTSLVDESQRKRIVILVSKFDHTLLHLLYQIRVGLARRRCGGGDFQPSGRAARSPRMPPSPSTCCR